MGGGNEGEGGGGGGGGGMPSRKFATLCMINKHNQEACPYTKAGVEGWLA